MALITNIVSYYKFDGNVTTDAVGSNDLTNNGADYDATAKINGGYDFVAANTDYMKVSSPSFLSNTAGTVNIWVKCDNLVNGQILWGSGDEGGGADFLYIVIRKDDNETYNDNTLNIISYHNGFDYSIYTPQDSLPTSGYHMFTFVSDGSAIKIYVDGVNQTLTTNLGTNNGNWFGDNAALDNFTIGTLEYNSGTFSGWLTAGIDEVGVWSVALSQALVTELYNSGDGLQYPFTAVAADNTLFMGMNF